MTSSRAKRKGLGSVMAVIGYLLSPLSWWNDLFVNVPLALAFAWAASYFYSPAFTASFVLGYWLTNVLGLVLMHRGAVLALSDRPSPYDRKQIIRDLVIALVYTALILGLVKLKIVGPIPGARGAAQPFHHFVSFHHCRSNGALIGSEASSQFN